MFIGSAAAGGVSGALALSCGRRQPPKEAEKENITGLLVERDLPETIAGMTLQQLRDDYHDRLFNKYLPFWEKGGIDTQYGGFMCLLNEDGTVADDEKYSWYQGRGLWTYSFLYNNFGKDKHFLDVAAKARDFIVTHMYAGNGTWYERLNRDGSAKEGVSNNVYGWLFIAAGLGEFYRATGNEEDYKLFLETVWATLRTYDNPAYKGSSNNGGLPAETDFTGMREQGHSMCLIWMLTQILSFKRNLKLEEVVTEHVDYIMKAFLHPYMLVTNEYLLHDMTRVPGSEDYMFTGHSLETQWIVMMEAIRQGDRQLFDMSKEMIKRYLTLSWDYVFEGFGDGHFYVFDGPDRTRQKLYGVKSMWSHTEILLATMHILEFSGELWASEWYERARAYSLRSFDTPFGVWRQAVDRFGNDVQREGIPVTRRDNFHPPRYMMMNLLSLDRMIKNKGKLSQLRYPIGEKA
jgi:mannose/cellobiose epimerase-like protein (N-acyl-D-glucosamine 2-epimerase family)